jgi:hypothetical protein
VRFASYYTAQIFGNGSSATATGLHHTVTAIGDDVRKP